MKLGILTAPFPDMPLTSLVDWAASAGFEALEIACWPASGDKARRLWQNDCRCVDPHGAWLIVDAVADARGGKAHSLWTDYIDSDSALCPLHRTNMKKEKWETCNGKIQDCRYQF
jgi:sugar phosphate isomerase/epimerase